MARQTLGQQRPPSIQTKTYINLQHTPCKTMPPLPNKSPSCDQSPPSPPPQHNLPQPQPIHPRTSRTSPLWQGPPSQKMTLWETHRTPHSKERLPSLGESLPLYTSDPLPEAKSSILKLPSPPNL
ncbi:Uncharacterized protein TCM_019819 [Theobroma cacao]|uniref:Uncharacterized protein n=1 Tax=Theobroma cacao TaxID=3641 RepID=A0A061EJM4_THECC|nr:Uncharacterized protein TCM_019819 [Theobroma cacao]